MINSLDMNAIVVLICVIVFSYLIGSLNFAIIVCKILGKEDIRNFGSGNAGMTNMLRVYGKIPAVLTTLGDFSKGIVAVAFSRMLFNMMGITSFDVGYIVGFAALIGHLYPVYFGFRGGKGVLTAFGIVLILNPFVFMLLFLCFVPLAVITRIVSLASVLGVITFPIVNFLHLYMHERPFVLEITFSVLLSVFIIYSHRENIKRLINKTEKRL